MSALLQAEVGNVEDSTHEDDVVSKLSPGNFRPLSHATGYSRVHISKVLRGIIHGSDKFINKLSSATGISPLLIRRHISNYRELRTIDSPGPRPASYHSSPSRESVGDKIKYHRLRINMTQGRLAELCDLSLSFISRVESHERLPGDESRRKISKVLGVKI